jgi:hypothetical protein
LKKKVGGEKETYINHSGLVIESLSLYNNRVSVNLVHANNNNILKYDDEKKTKRYDFFSCSRFLFLLEKKLIQIKRNKFEVADTIKQVLFIRQ